MNLIGTDFFHLVDDKIYSNDSLDRDSSKPPKGTGSHVTINVRCVIYDNQTGIQYTIEKSLGIDVLDQNDNPPNPQINGSVEIHLKDFLKVRFIP